MGYDIQFKVRTIDGSSVTVGEQYANITWNVGDMIRVATGLEWRNEEDNGLCVDVMPKIVAGLKELVTNPQKYKKYEASNGWGTIDGTIYFFNNVIEAVNVFFIVNEASLTNHCRTDRFADKGIIVAPA